MLRDLRITDLEALHELYSDPDVMEYLGGPFEDKSETKEELEISGLSEDRTRFAVVNLRQGTFIGEVTFCIHTEDDLENEAEIGWTLEKKSWNRGYAQQLTALLIDYARSKGAKAVYLCCEEDQEVPKHIAEKFSMEYVGLQWGQACYRRMLENEN